MVSVYLISSVFDKDIREALSTLLTQRGYNIINDKGYTDDENLRIREAINIADVYITIISIESLEVSYYMNELIRLSNYSGHSNKLFLPICYSDIQFSKLHESITNVPKLKLESKPADAGKELEELAVKIDENVNSFLGRRLAIEEKNLEIKEKIESSATEYISETLTELMRRESYLRRMANLWYILGFVILIAGIFVAFWMTNQGLAGFDGKENWSKTIFFFIKSLFIIVLLIASSKYSFTLAKSYMNESLKIADRVHAISFGKFYLRIFNQQIQPSELKEIFRDWNINNQSSFLGQKTEDYDPKLVEIIEKLKDIIKR